MVMGDDISKNKENRFCVINAIYISITRREIVI